MRGRGETVSQCLPGACGWSVGSRGDRGAVRTALIVHISPARDCAFSTTPLVSWVPIDPSAGFRQNMSETHFDKRIDVLKCLHSFNHLFSTRSRQDWGCERSTDEKSYGSRGEMEEEEERRCGGKKMRSSELGENGFT